MLRYLVAVTSAEEDLNRQPVVAADLEAVLLVNLINLGNLLISQAPAIKVKVGLDALLSDALGEHTPAFLDTPLEEDLLHSLALGLGELGEAVELVERRVAAAQGGVPRAVNALGLAELEEVGGRVAGVELDLVDGGDDLRFDVSVKGPHLSSPPRHFRGEDHKSFLPWCSQR